MLASIIFKCLLLGFQLIDACSTVAGACLEQPTWLKRNKSLRDFDAVEDDSLTGKGFTVYVIITTG